LSDSRPSSAGSRPSSAGSRPTRPYLFYDTTISLCARCHRRVDAKIVIEGEDVLLLKRCPQHGPERVLLADDAAYYKLAREAYLKPPDQPRHHNTPARYGCPYDCGLCPEHEQHSCVSVVEVTDHCNLRCPTCYAGSGPERTRHRSLDEIERMFDAIVRNEGEADVVQLSGGEPTLHPQFFEILERARARPFRHLMVNTNGLRIASDPAFAERLASYGPGLELYLQFDSLERAPLELLRGEDLRRVRDKALARLNELNLSTTLVVTLRKGVNDGEIGRIVEHALAQPCVRGVTLQPVQDAGRNEGFDPARDRLTLTAVRRALLAQTTLFSPEDVIPVPCHPDSLAMAYGLKQGGRLVPLTSLIERSVLLDAGANSIVFERDEALKQKLFALFSTGHSPASSTRSLSDLLCCFPDLKVPELRYDQLFRVLIVQFMDVHGFDERSVKKSCVHMATPDGKLIPFDTYNLFYRDDLARTRLAPLRAASAAAEAAHRAALEADAAEPRSEP
jgi:7,8-dihydro-6-hydroxymethylpterin dimethyltransferase